MIVNFGEKSVTDRDSGIGKGALLHPDIAECKGSNGIFKGCGGALSEKSRASFEIQKTLGDKTRQG